MSEKIQIIVDGRPTEAKRGDMLLSVLQDMGVNVPTLCHHSSLEPSGACRLCVVEITHADWGGWSGIVTSCLYPVEPGLQVLTRSQKVRESRRTLLELYLAQCPDSEEVKAMARSEGVDETSFPKREEADDCILCGLCTRVCNDLGPAAIAPLGRGTEKSVGPRLDKVGEDCTACGACALICPTGEIKMEHKNSTISIWNREFEIPVCKVNPDLCRACGICEEVCPVAVPRVSPHKNTGTFIAQISETACVGCGVCVGSCPTGAIYQQVMEDACLEPAGDLHGRTVVYACSRSPLPKDTENLIRVPCIGKVPIDNMLACLAKGADGVLMMCRDQATCPHGRGGALAAERIKVADDLAVSVGLGQGRIRYAKPNAGLKGPPSTLNDYIKTLKSTPLQTTYIESDHPSSGMDRTLEILWWLRTEAGLKQTLPTHLKKIFDKGEHDSLLYLGNLCDLDLLLTLLIKGWRLRDLFKAAVKILKKNNINATPVMTPLEVEQSKASQVILLSKESLPSFERGVKVITIDELAGCGETESVLQMDSFRFWISPKERQDLLAKLKGMTSETIVCASPEEVAQVKLSAREGSWLEAVYGEAATAFSEILGAAAGKVDA